MKDWVKRTIVRYGLLFLVAVVLVAGFWFHSSFYDLGLGPLLVIGGTGVFFVLLAIRASATGRLWRPRPSGELRLRPEQTQALASGTLTLGIVRLDVAVPPVGSIVTTKIPGVERTPLRLEVRDIHRKLVSDVSESEARSAGYSDAGQFHRAWSDGRHWKPLDIALLITLRPEERP